LSELNHPNVITFFGFHKNEKDEKFLIFEYMAGGNLLNLLKSDHKLKIKDLIRMSIGAATGMNYLESKKILHRDLAARNILVDKRNDLWNVKVSDFGLSRHSLEEGIYILSESSVIPARWTAPEVFQKREFSVKCDIWAMGIVLWEIFTKGSLPYSELSNKQVTEAVIKGERLPKPDSCPDGVWIIMKNCWNEIPSKRPTFLEIIKQLNGIIATTEELKEDVPSSSREPEPQREEYNGIPGMNLGENNDVPQ